MIPPNTTPIGWEVMDLADPRAMWRCYLTAREARAEAEQLAKQGSVAYMKRFWSDGLTERRTITKLPSVLGICALEVTEWELLREQPFWNVTTTTSEAL